MKVNRAKVYGYNSLIGGILSIVCAILLMIFAVFLNRDIICVIMSVFAAISGVLLIARSLSHEASLAENSELIDERSV